MSIALVISIAVLALSFMAVFFWKMCVEQRRGGLCRVVKLGSDAITLDPSFAKERLDTSLPQGKVVPIATRSTTPNSEDIRQVRQHANSPNATRRMWK